MKITCTKLYNISYSTFHKHKIWWWGPHSCLCWSRRCCRIWCRWFLPTFTSPLGDAVMDDIPFFPYLNAFSHKFDDYEFMIMGCIAIMADTDTYKACIELESKTNIFNAVSFRVIHFHIQIFPTQFHHYSLSLSLSSFVYPPIPLWPFSHSYLNHCLPFRRSLFSPLILLQISLFTKYTNHGAWRSDFLAVSGMRARAKWS